MKDVDAGKKKVFYDGQGNCLTGNEAYLKSKQISDASTAGTSTGAASTKQGAVAKGRGGKRKRSLKSLDPDDLG